MTVLPNVFDIRRCITYYIVRIDISLLSLGIFVGRMHSMY